MFFHNALKKLFESPDFKNWKKDNTNDYLSTGFIVIEKDQDYPWMIGFYNPKTEKISSFVVSEKECYFEKIDEVFKKPEDKVIKLNTDKIKIDVEDLLEIIDNFRKEKYNHESVVKTILIVQNLSEYGNIWNITLVTQSFNAINMKVNAETGEILDDKCSSLISYTAG